MNRDRKSAETGDRNQMDRDRKAEAGDREQMDRDRKAETGDKNRMDSDRKSAETGDKNQMDPDRKAETGDRDPDRETGDRTAVRIDSDQKQKVRTYFSQHRPSSNRIDKGRVSVSIGVPLPIGIALAPLPPDIIVVAADCPLQYFVWGDDVVLVDSCSRQVVDIILSRRRTFPTTFFQPRSPGRSAGASHMCCRGRWQGSGVSLFCFVRARGRGGGAGK
jgi:hypothetical protein